MFSHIYIAPQWPGYQYSNFKFYRIFVSLPSCLFPPPYFLRDDLHDKLVFKKNSSLHFFIKFHLFISLVSISVGCYFTFSLARGMFNYHTSWFNLA